MIVSIADLGESYCNRIRTETGEEFYNFKSARDAEAALLQAEIILTYFTLDARLLDQCHHLKWMFILTAGVDRLPFDDLIRLGIQVSNVGGIHATQISEQTIGTMIAFSRSFKTQMENQQKKIWNRHIPLSELTQKTLCIVGAGRIGWELARKAKAFDMRVIGLKKHAEPLEYFDEVWQMSRLHEALRSADYTVLLTPLTDETYHLMGKPEFDSMKQTGIFINMSRGDTVDEPALIEALKKGIIRGAALDVFQKEPLDAGSPLWDFPNVMITPHSAGLSPYYLDRAVDLFTRSYRSYRRGEPIPNKIDLLRKY